MRLFGSVKNMVIFARYYYPVKKGLVMDTGKQQPQNYLPGDERRQDGVHEEAMAYATQSRHLQVLPPCQFTVEELKEILLRSELDGDGVTNDAFFAELEKEDAELWR